MIYLNSINVVLLPPPRSAAVTAASSPPRELLLLSTIVDEACPPLMPTLLAWAAAQGISEACHSPAAPSAATSLSRLRLLLLLLLRMSVEHTLDRPPPSAAFPSRRCCTSPPEQLLPFQIRVCPSFAAAVQGIYRACPQLPSPAAPAAAVPLSDLGSWCYSCSGFSCTTPPLSCLPPIDSFPTPCPPSAASLP